MLQAFRKTSERSEGREYLECMQKVDGEMDEKNATAIQKISLH